MDMEPILWGVSFLLAMAVGVLSFYLWRFRRQVNHISEQLEIGRASGRERVLCWV